MKVKIKRDKNYTIEYGDVIVTQHTNGEFKELGYLLYFDLLNGFDGLLELQTMVLESMEQGYADINEFITDDLKLEIVDILDKDEIMLIRR